MILIFPLRENDCSALFLGCATHDGPVTSELCTFVTWEGDRKIRTAFIKAGCIPILELVLLLAASHLNLYPQSEMLVCLLLS